MVVLAHHGLALAREVEPTQPLSGPGRESSQRLAAAVAARGARPDVIWHSGKFRARQTAELFWHACNPGALFSVARGLQPTDPPGALQSRLESDDRSILVVGHLPHLARLLRALRGERPDSATAGFPSHGCVALGWEAGRWQELWRLTGILDAPDELPSDSP